MASMDVFSGDAFSLRTLTAAVNVPQYAPSRIAELGVFEEQAVTTTKVSVERLAQPISLVTSTTRGGPASEVASPLRTLYDLNTVRVALSDKITADETQGIRAFGTDSEVVSLQAEVNRRNQALAANISATMEYQRLSALQGVTKDGDGSTLVDTNAVFGTGAVGSSTIDCDGTAGTLRGAVSSAIRTIEAGLDGRPYGKNARLRGFDLHR